MKPKKFSRPGLALALAITWIVPSVLADVVVLKNGDRITGEIQEIWDKDVVIEPKYDDDVKVSISLDLVAYLESEREFDAVLGDGREVVVELLGDGGDGQELIRIDGVATSIALGELVELDEIEDYYDWESHFDFNTAINKGNTDSVNAKFYADTSLKLGDHRHIADLTINREEQDHISTKEQDLARYNYNWLFNDPWFFGGSLSFERDPIKDLEYRFITGATIGRDIWAQPRRLLNFQTGLGYLTEREESTGETQESVVGIWAVRWRHDFFSEDLEAYHDHSINIYLTGRTNTVIKTTTGIRYEITDLLYANVSLDYDYETQPAGTAENEDLSLVVGLGVEF
jgi:hypothetical protein